MLLCFILATAAAAAPVSAPTAEKPVWETYVCESGPTVQIALVGGRPATQGFIAVDKGATITVTPHKGEAPAVLRGQGYMVQPFNWIDLLYAPPGREKNAYQCRIAGASDKPLSPKLE